MTPRTQAGGVRLWLNIALGALVALALALALFTEYESYASLYDAAYTGAETCGECHTGLFPQWQRSPHANMLRAATPESVVGDFELASWQPPGALATDPPAATMYRSGERYMMALRHPVSGEDVPFEIAYVVGYQYRQTYLTREPGGVLRRLPLQWSTERREYFPYWNFQEGSTPSLLDLWSQMRSLNSAWNLFCARCHTTKLTVVDKDAEHTRANTHWVDDGIACEACHGPGSQHVNYMRGNPVNRVVAYLNSTLRGQPVAYIASAPKLSKDQALSVCARCHGSDILRTSMDVYRLYEPGYSRSGRINDLSEHFKEAPLTPGRRVPTLETWADGRPKGIGMLFRSFVESACYEHAEVRCHDCHDPHDNKRAAGPGLLEPSPASNAYCLACHTELVNRVAAHSRHREGSPGAYCYDCHMARSILNAATGVARFVRSHTMSEIPSPASTARHGADAAPNACNDCHGERSPAWAAEYVADWSEADPG